MNTTIDLTNKFTSSNFEDIINKYWKETFTSTKVVFDLSKLEWIANEQISFLVSWINELWENQIKVSIIFQSSKDVLTNSIEFNRRSMCYTHLVANWRFLELINSKTELIEQGIKYKGYKYKDKPFKEQTLINYNSETFDSEFNNLYETQLKPFLNFLLKEINDNTELNYFDNQFLTYSLIKEFYSNSCQHAFTNNKNKKCYFSVNINNRIERYTDDLLQEKLEDRFAERPIEEIPFFKIDDSTFNNESFIEVTFFDLGEGISKTIQANYLEENDLKSKFNEKHFNQNNDTRSLEYAFLLFASRYEIGKDFSMHDYIPRGLFVIKEIVKKYNGMIIARSNSGKVVFNYSTNSQERIHYRLNDSDNKIGIGFPGTSVTIVLPAIIKNGKSKIISQNVIEEKLPKLRFLSVLELVNETKSNKRIQAEKLEIKKRILFFEIFFTELSNRIIEIEKESKNKLQNSNESIEEKQNLEINAAPASRNLIMFDFAGIERSSQDIFDKFIFFITYCPFISTQINVCLFNLIEKNTNSILIQVENHLYKSKGFSPSPIPCIHPDFEVSWLGINNSYLEEILTTLWKNDDRKNQIESDITHLASNIVEVVVEDFKHMIYKFRIVINSYYEIISEIYQHHKVVLENEVKGRGLKFHELAHRNQDYNIVLNKKIDIKSNQRRAFLTSNSKYQKVFLTFIEKLYLREYRRLISIYLFYNFLYDHGVQIEELNKTTKILTVTLSSQLLGKEFVDIANQLFNMVIPIKLVPLSNYYDFNTEEPFKELTNEDKIIIVNDVISTGNLSRKIENSLKDKTTILGFITIADSRTSGEKKDLILTKLTSLVSISIKKYSNNPFPNTKPVWINPILNSPTTMSREKSNNKSILQSPQEFLRNFSDDSLFKIGNFIHNTVFHSYYLNTDQLIKDEINKGFPIITILLNKLKDRLKEEQNSSLENDILDISRIKKKYFSQEKSVRQIGESATAVNNAFNKIENVFYKELFDNKQYELFGDKDIQLIDFIFYPFLSSISDIEKNLAPLSIQLRGSNKINVFPIPRIMTPRGWRFSFPPKFLNNYSKNSKALIIDDGSCTGDTLIQMIDSLSFLELSELNVLSIFARLEDFQREFLTRIKKIKVKDSETKFSDYKIIPLNVFFGTHFHIPVYSKHTHYINTEIREIIEIIEYYKNAEEVLPKQLKEYLEIRLELLQNPVNVTEASIELPEKVDKRTMFLIRDIIGNYDSYRLFKEDEFSGDGNVNINESNFNDILNDIVGKYSLIAVINHEPSVANTINRIYPEVIIDIKKFCISALKTDKNINNLEVQFLFTGLAIIDINSVFNPDLLLSILEISENKTGINYPLYNYISFIFIRELINNKTIPNKEAHLNFLRILLQIIYNRLIDRKLIDKGYFNLIKDLYRQFLSNTKTTSTTKLKAIYQVQTYYSLQNINTSNNFGSPSHPNAYLSFTLLVNTLSGFINMKPNEMEEDKFIKDAIEIFNGIRKKLIAPLKEVIVFLAQFYNNNDLNIDFEKYKKIISDFDILEESLKSNNFKIKTLCSEKNIKLTIIWLKDFQLQILRASSELPRFFTQEHVDLQKLFYDIIEEYTLSKEIKPNIKILVPDNIEIKIHPYLMRLIIYELVENKTKYAPDSEGHLEYFELKDSFVIKYHQNKPFIPHKEENGLKTIRNIVNKYGGICRDSVIGNFEFLMSFNKILKNT